MKPMGDALADVLKPEDVLRLVRLDPSDWGECCSCGRRTSLEWSVTLHNGEYGFLCGDCGLSLQKQLRATK